MRMTKEGAFLYVGNVSLVLGYARHFGSISIWLWIHIFCRP